MLKASVVSLSKKRYHRWTVLLGSRNAFDRDLQVHHCLFPQPTKCIFI